MRKIRETEYGITYSDAPKGYQGSTIFVPHKESIECRKRKEFMEMIKENRKLLNFIK